MKKVINKSQELISFGYKELGFFDSKDDFCTETISKYEDLGYNIVFRDIGGGVWHVFTK